MICLHMDTSSGHRPSSHPGNPNLLSSPLTFTSNSTGNFRFVSTQTLFNRPASLRLSSECSREKFPGIKSDLPTLDVADHMPLHLRIPDRSYFC